MDKLQNIIDSIFNENCETGMAKIPDNSVNCILTDPPYLYLRNTKLDTPFDVECVMNYIERMKPAYTGNRRQRHHVTAQSGFKSQDRCESVMQILEIGMTEKDIIKIARPHYNTWHPTTKPTMLIKRLLNITTHTGDLVVDPFAGSCSTAKACLDLGRHYICFEKDKDYFGKACEDVRNYQRGKAEKDA